MSYQRVKRISALSTIDILGPISATVNGATEDWTSGTIEVAIVAAGTAPETGDWITATSETSSDGTLMTKLLVGPNGGDITLTAGYWDHYSRITFNGERPVEQHGSFEVY